MNKFCGLEVLFSNVHPSNEGMILQEENGRHSLIAVAALCSRTII